MSRIPSVIPPYIKESNQINRQGAVLRTDMETGSARQRRLSANVPVQITVKWLLNSRQMRIFEAWHHHILYDGTAWFTMPIVNGEGANDCDCRFVSGAYTTEGYGNGIWVIAATLEVRSMPVMSEEDLLANLEAGGDIARRDGTRRRDGSFRRF